MKRHIAALVFALTTMVALPGALASSAMAAPDLGQFTTDGAVQAIVSSGGDVYVGGSFERVGPYSGSGVGIDRVTGKSIGFPAFSLGVSAVVSDGAEGWYIGGSFTNAGGTTQSDLVHVRADRSIDPMFDAHADGEVTALALSGSTLYVGGSFTNIGGAPRQHIAEIDAATGTAAAWDPGANGHVSALAVDGSSIDVGGDFTSIAGQARQGLAQIDLAGTATAWNPALNADAYVRSLAVAGTTVYVGGFFQTAGGQARQGLAALDDVTGQATAWDPAPPADSGGAEVDAIAIDGATIYVGGTFSSMGGQKRACLAALDAATGAATDWNPKLAGSNGNLDVDALAMTDGAVYAGGLFSTAGGQARTDLVALDPATGAATAWNPSPDGQVSALAASEQTVFAGGQFVMLGGIARSGLAAFDARTGAPTPWNPGSDGGVDSLALSGHTLYVGGDFTKLGAHSHNHLGALDLASGRVLNWRPNVGEAGTAVTEIAPAKSAVYVGGTFTSAGGRKRLRLAAVTRRSGALTAWNPSSDGYVGALTVSGSTVYVGGQFSLVGGNKRPAIAALDARSGRAKPWNPRPAGRTPVVTAIVVTKSRIYVGGVFDTIGGKTRSELAALDPQTGAAAAWNPRVRSVGGKKIGVMSLVLHGNRLYAGGGFSTVGGKPHRGIAAIDVRTASVNRWQPPINFYSTALGLSGSAIFAGTEYFPGLVRLVPPA